MSRGTLLKIVLGTAAVILLVVLASWALGFYGGMNAAGIAALSIGIVLSAGLGIGLMALVFYSSRGYDEAVYHVHLQDEPPPDEERRPQ
jgi:hypothetical protein